MRQGIKQDGGEKNRRAEDRPAVASCHYRWKREEETDKTPIVKGGRCWRPPSRERINEARRPRESKNLASPRLSRPLASRRSVSSPGASTLRDEDGERPGL
jgi:hypothetical protein